MSEASGGGRSLDRSRICPVNTTLFVKFLDKGFTNPILIDNDMNILAGYGRIKAAKSIAMTDVPCVRLDTMTDAQKRAYVLADNKLAQNAG